MRFARSGGLLLHPTSLPGPGGIGAAGAEAYAFVDALAGSGLTLWQVLPLGPTGYGDAPYSSFSAFAGNPLLIAFEPLQRAGLLQAPDLVGYPDFPPGRVDYGQVIPAKLSVLRKVWTRWRERGPSERFERFRAAHAGWLEDFVLFMALKDAHDGRPWNEWEPELRDRQPEALDRIRQRQADDLDFHRFLQYAFFDQWLDLKRHANQQGVRLVGDIPIFVAYDSADVWAHQDLFQLDERGRPLVVAGVPPDYFSATGQLWGNPHYRWDVMEARGFDWWVDRFRATLELVDIIRLDHFRGFAASWAVPYGDPTAERGEWVTTPGRALFDALRATLGELPIIAEDLGYITPDVDALRDRFGFPGMHILEFAFGTDASNPSLPHNLPRNSVVYTGTHDNDTVVGWFESVPIEEREFVRRYLDNEEEPIQWGMIRLAFSSVADIAVAPVQDVLGLGPEARLNYPGRPEGNWTWRLLPGQLGTEEWARVRELATTFGRSGATEER